MSHFSVLTLSVRELVEYSLRSGSIHSVFFSSNRMLDGIEGHKSVQQKRPSTYKSEVSISGAISFQGYSITLRGRIDGLFRSLDHFVLEEIKTTSRPLSSITRDDNPHYWAQAKCYAYLYSKEHDLSSIVVQLCYFNIDTKKERTFSEVCNFNELETFVFSLLGDYLSWIKLVINEREKRDFSLSSFLSFPFPQFRKGQKQMIDFVRSHISSGQIAFCQAPTGIGKTIAVLYPAIEYLQSDPSAQIFYLTSKTTQKAIAEKTLDLLRKKGLKIKSVTLTAKSQICFKEKSVCDPSLCEYADGHFDRINDAIKDIFSKDSFTRKRITKYAQKHRVCPFEFSLDLSLFSDCIICDYNYLFDPRVKLKRFFDFNSGSYVFLIDEAHNLVERARNMFSAELNKRTFLLLKRKTKEILPHISKLLGALNKHMINFRKDCEQKGKRDIALLSPPKKDFIRDLKKFIVESEKWLALNILTDFREELLELYFDVRSFLNIAELYDSNYVTYYSKQSKGDLLVKLFCIDPSILVNKELKKGHSSIFFSATLTPLDYYVNLLVGERRKNILELDSPFPPENFLVLINDTISTKYKDRNETFNEIVEAIVSFIETKKGNFMVYFPSYEYMQKVVPYVKEYERTRGMEIIVQDKEMKESDREIFLKKFHKHGKRTLVGFVVLGGVFGESIDLVGEKLSGVVVVGVGLPKICFERELMKNYFDAKMKQGFHYSYTFPGLNRVLQAVGRLIRTEKDRGVVLLIDDRFTNPTYKRLLPCYWRNVMIVKNSKEISIHALEFWEKKRKRKKRKLNS